jgi:c(7)-type cytochrome triheme protein
MPALSPGDAQIMSTAVRLAMAVLVALLLVRNAKAEFGDITFAHKGGGNEGVPPAVFPHFVHRIQFKCYVCHEDIFVMKAGGNAITMDAIQSGKFCGICHNGKIAFQVLFDTCQRCHRP